MATLPKVPCCFISESEQLRAANEKTKQHLNTCNRGCGHNYEPGACKEADALFEEAGRIAREFPGESCTKHAEWSITVEGASYDDYTLACTDHVGHMLTDAPANIVSPFDLDR